MKFGSTVVCQLFKQLRKDEGKVFAIRAAEIRKEL